MVNIYVSSGSFNYPFYEFYLDPEKKQKLENLELDPSKEYTFKRIDNATSHPFYISDQGYSKASSEKIKLTGDGNASSGIKGNESFTLTFNDKTFQSTLYFYCTSHSLMMAQFNIAYESVSLPPKIKGPSETYDKEDGE